MIPLTARRWLGRKARWYLYAAGAALLFVAVTIRVFWFMDSATATAFAGIYGAFAATMSIFVAAALGIQQLAPQPPQPSPTLGEPDGRPEA